MTANTTQVGGEHYRAAPFQHWDLAALLKLGYFEGQITKYITRHPRKNGAQDALKALHFTVKLAELASTGGWQPAHLYPTQAMLRDYTESNRLSAMDARIIQEVLTWQHRRDLDRVKMMVVELVMSQYGSRYLGDIAKCLGGQTGLDAVCCMAFEAERLDPGLFDDMVKGQYRPVCAPPSGTPDGPALDGDIYRSTAYAAAATKEIRPTDAGQVSHDMAVAVRKVMDATEAVIEKGCTPTDGSAPDAGYVNQD